MTKLPMKMLTMQQQLFLEALKGDARGDFKLARDLAGYSPNTRMSDIIRPLKDHIVAAIRDILVEHGPQAAFGLVDVIVNPAMVGAANQIKAATEILDRVGVTTPSEEQSNQPKAAVFILPPKGIQNIEIKDGNISINMDDGDIKTIDIDNEQDTEDEEDGFEDEPELEKTLTLTEPFGTVANHE